MSTQDPQLFCFSGLRIHALSFDQAIAQIVNLIQRREGGYVLTPNVDHVVLVQSNEDFRKSYEQANLVFVDGMPIVWVSKLLGPPLPQKISGSDLIEPLMQKAAEYGFRVYLLGTKREVAERAANKLREQFPALNIVGSDSPFIDINAPESAHRPVLEKLREAKPDIVLTALGSPKQEIFVHRYRDAIAPAVAIGIGAGLDFLAGVVPRAPKWVSKSGLEWLYRLGLEPRRLWKRYLVRDPKFAWIVLKELYARAKERGP